MRQRLAQILGEDSENRQFMPWMGTFSVFACGLRMDGENIGE